MRFIRAVIAFALITLVVSVSLAADYSKVEAGKARVAIAMVQVDHSMIPTQVTSEAETISADYARGPNRQNLKEPKSNITRPAPERVPRE